MKQLKSGLYKAANLTFNPSTISAHSYAWWEFVRVIKGKVVFNEYRYSVTTAKHQRKIRDLMHDLGIKIDLKVNVRQSLKDFTTLTTLKEESLKTAKFQLEEKLAKLVARRERAKELRKMIGVI